MNEPRLQTTDERLILIPVEPAPEFIESSGRWKWPLKPPHDNEGRCPAVYTASREWWEYAPDAAKPHPWAEATQLRDGKWYWAVPPNRGGEGSFSLRFSQMWHDLAESPVKHVMRYTNAQLFMDAADERIERLKAALDEAEAVIRGEHGPDWSEHFGPLFNLIEAARL